MKQAKELTVALNSPSMAMVGASRDNKLLLFFLLITARLSGKCNGTKTVPSHGQLSWQHKYRHGGLFSCKC